MPVKGAGLQYQRTEAAILPQSGYRMGDGFTRFPMRVDKIFVSGLVQFI